MEQHYWLMKSEPDVFSIDDLVRLNSAPWDGIRNYQVRNLLRDHFQIGDLAFFYHSSCKEPAIVGIMQIITTAYPDSSALDPSSPYFDPKSTSEKLPWLRVDVQLVHKLTRPITLATLRQHSEPLTDLPLLKRGNRLSITPVTPEQWHYILALVES
ncbi:MAG: EVE domain-containing protein [Thiofilum sp.]|uniref:EVE domain-containing protein n=1 Tax=Thiofilum sp. TaxID=2212733 RepID=UPI0025E82216|nr:EVE domain-containing protein [Thiofilum sp.]MBK8453561.1 EVE domain-containing protein [Thiofilum sp.]